MNGTDGYSARGVVAARLGAMSWETSEIKSWSEFLRLIDQLCPTDRAPEVFFRGQSDAEWPLQPTLLRLLGRGQLERESALIVESQILLRFQTQAHLHMQHPMLNPGSSLELWNVMRHHFAPARVLDWTESPYVAAFFAVEECADVDGSIWAFDALKLRERMKVMTRSPFAWEDRYEEPPFFDVESPETLIPTVNLRMTDRMVAQQGRFTVCWQILGDHAAIIEKTLASVRPPIKIVIPAHLKDEFLARLWSMNVNASALFPGTDGVGRSMKDWGRLMVWRKTKATQAVDA